MLASYDFATATNNRQSIMFHVKQFSTDVEFLWKKNPFRANFLFALSLSI